MSYVAHYYISMNPTQILFCQFIPHKTIDQVISLTAAIVATVKCLELRLFSLQKGNTTLDKNWILYKNPNPSIWSKKDRGCNHKVCWIPPTATWKVNHSGGNHVVHVHVMVSLCFFYLYPYERLGHWCWLMHISEVIAWSKTTGFPWYSRIIMKEKNSKSTKFHFF